MPPNRSRLGGPDRRTLLAALAGTGLAMPFIARAQGAYPDRPLRIIVNFAPGGPTDIIARLLSVPLSAALGQPVVVENRAGAGGNIGIAATARSTPDGYTLLITSSAYVVNPSLYSNVPYDAFRDFAPVAELGTSPNIILANPASGITSLGDLVAKAKAAPGTLSYASPGSGTTPHLAGELLKLRAGVDILHVPFNGAGPAIQAILSGTVPVASTALPPAQPQVKAGALRGLAVTGAQRWPDLPDVPTAEEAGVSGLVSETFQALLAPAGTPKPIVDRLTRDTLAVLAQPAMRQRLQESGFAVLAGGQDALAKRIAEEVPMWRDVITRSGVKAD
ncbi:Bug family tripartite tricarboxylate transporter substrate binding protein [Roseomonas sp. BN140053]|uniref:Bug family tripartite tricarboxylate transporter substrate binding protein n=1 Tax=Roseomonas sp. BN140053 TaxID=3391898 RepID=UPI0039EBFF1B